MNREFLFNIFLLLFINVLIKPFFIFGIDLTVQNRVGADYGLYFALLNLAYVFQILNDFGLQNFNNSNISRHPQLLPKYFPNFLALKLLLSTAYVVITLFAAFFVLGYGSRELPLLLILLVNQVLVQLIFFMRSNVSGLGYYRVDSFLSSLDKLLMLFSCGILLWANPLPIPFTIETFALAQTLALVLTLLIAYFLLRLKVTFSLRPSWARNWRAGLPAVLFLLRKSVPYALVILLMFAYSRLDAVILERMLPDGKEHADVYAGAYRLLDACNMFGYLFATLLLPMFARLLRRGGMVEVRSLVSLSFKLIWSGAITLTATIFFARVHLIQLMMPARASAYRWDMLGVLIWVFIPVCVIYIFSTLLTAHERLMQMNRFFVIGIGIDLVLNFLLIPHYKAFGAAVATLSTHLFVAGTVVWLCARTFDFKPSRRGLIQVIGYALFVIGFDWYVFDFTNYNWPVKAGIALGAGAVGMLFFQMIDTRKLRRVFANQG